jgi:hypothetical protein
MHILRCPLATSWNRTSPTVAGGLAWKGDHEPLSERAGHFDGGTFARQGLGTETAHPRIETLCLIPAKDAPMTLRSDIGCGLEAASWAEYRHSTGTYRYSSKRFRYSLLLG